MIDSHKSRFPCAAMLHSNEIPSVFNTLEEN